MPSFGIELWRDVEVATCGVFCSVLPLFCCRHVDSCCSCSLLVFLVYDTLCCSFFLLFLFLSSLDLDVVLTVIGLPAPLSANMTLSCRMSSGSFES